MKVGDRLTIEYAPYDVESVGRGRVTLRRKRKEIGRVGFENRLRARRWRRLVSGVFIVDRKTRQTLGTYDLLALGIPSKRIERLLSTLPIMETE